MKVSITIPAYNCESTIGRCIESIAAQSFRDFEVIIVEDCSTDNTYAILQDLLENDLWLKERTVLVRNDVNRGLGFTRYRGQSLARGEYLIPVDSDDYVAPDFLRHLVEVADRDGSDMVMCGHFVQVGDKITRQEVVGASTHDSIISNVLSGKINNYLWNKLVRRSLLEAHQIHTIEGLNFYECKSIAFKIAYFAKKISFLNEPLYYHVKSKTNMTSCITTLYVDQAMRLLDVIDEFFKINEVNDEISQGIYKCKALVASVVLRFGTDRQLQDYLPVFDGIPVSEILSSEPPLYRRLGVLLNHYGFRKTAALVCRARNFLRL